MSMSATAGKLQMVGQAAARAASASTLRVFWTCTAVVWGGVGVRAVLFYVGQLDFVTSAKIGLYAISFWLNAWIVVFADHFVQQIMGALGEVNATSAAALLGLFACAVRAMVG